MYESRWASGIRWYFTMLHPMFFLIQGEIIYTFLFLIYFPSMTTLKVILLLIGIMTLAKLSGYSIGQMARRYWRFLIGRKRPIYSLYENRKRFLAGI